MYKTNYWKKKTWDLKGIMRDLILKRFFAITRILGLCFDISWMMKNPYTLFDQF